MKVMGTGLDGGTSFMEDYTYDFSDEQPKVLGAHMLEICESIAADTISLEIHPLFVGGKSDPPRLIFDVSQGPALNASLIDMGNRFRLIVNEVDVIPPDQPLSKLPVARAVWIPRPDLKTAASAWILAGGAHHTGFSQAVKVEHLEDFAEIADIEFLVIGNETQIPAWKKELRWNDLYYLLKGGH
jgi:L-arabinose isomerase